MPNRNQGLSLLQLLVAMSIGILLLGSTMQVFLGIKQSYHLQQELSRLQEKARTVTVIFTEQLQNIDNIRGFNSSSHQIIMVTSKHQTSEIYLQNHELILRQNQQIESLLSGIIKFSIKYGKINHRNQTLEFLSTLNKHQRINVHWVKLEMIFSSESNYLNKPVTLWFAGSQWFAPDHRLYLSWSMIIPVTFKRK